jgi:hypothetical protein
VKILGWADQPVVGDGVVVGCVQIMGLLIHLGGHGFDEGLPAGRLQLDNVSQGRNLPAFVTRRSLFSSISHKIRRG